MQKQTKIHREHDAWAKDEIEDGGGKRNYWQ
jgi:hypothetical protein